MALGIRAGTTCWEARKIPELLHAADDPGELTEKARNSPY